MLWFLLSLLTAISHSTRDLFSKKSLQKVDIYIIAWSIRSFALPFLLPILLFIQIPILDSTFWYAVIIGGTLNLIVSIIYMKAIKISPLSLTVPMLTFTPLFLLITSPIIVGEFPTIYGVIGILLIVLGAYVLNIRGIGKNLLTPFKMLVKEKGSVLMLIVAFVWSITSNIDKIAVQHSSPLFYTVVFNVFISCLFLPLLFVKSRKEIRKIPLNVKSLLLIGLFSALIPVFQFYAISLTLVAYVISIKRTSAIFSSLYGFFFFKEKHMKERLLGAVIMVIGVLFIALF